ncbi:hypothetical protein [Dactylosporangium sp. NPDC051484]|uniref:hypothetical protein n=1 Tax=Dactylosporangium sp. NPDC051484 TaxID=3154942 RepID=UPI0034501672
MASKPTADRIVVGGTDITDFVTAVVAIAPPFTAEQRDLLRRLFAVPADEREVPAHARANRAA